MQNLPLKFSSDLCCAFWETSADYILLYKAKGEGATEDEMVRQHHDSMDMNLSQFQEIGEAREAWHAAVHGGVARSQIQFSNLTTTKIINVN